MTENDDLLAGFNIGTDNITDKYKDVLREYISKKDFEILLDHNEQSKKMIGRNISKKETEKQKVIRLKKRGSTEIIEFQNRLLQSGIKIPLATIADFLILKAINKL